MDTVIPLLWRRLAAAFLIVGLTACGSTPTVTILPPTSSPAASFSAQPTVAGQIDLTLLTGHIVFTAGPHPHEDIYVINADGSSLTRLTTDPAADYDPAWSPDGAHIVFRSRRDGNDEIYVMNADGSEQTNLTNDPAMDLSPVWSPDGSQIAFASDRYGNQSTLWLMNADGSEQRRISDETGEYPAWSPDGTQLAFDHQTFSASVFDIWVMNVDGSAARLLAGGPTSQQGPAWSPDGRQIAFESEFEAESHFDHVWLMNADGSEHRRLSQEYGGRPVWSPDGSYILFQAGHLYVMRADGSAVIRLPIDGLGELAFPDWIQ